MLRDRNLKAYPNIGEISRLYLRFNPTRCSRKYAYGVSETRVIPTCQHSLVMQADGPRSNRNDFSLSSSRHAFLRSRSSIDEKKKRTEKKEKEEKLTSRYLTRASSTQRESFGTRLASYATIRRRRRQKFAPHLQNTTTVISEILSTDRAHARPCDAQEIPFESGATRLLAPIDSRKTRASTVSTRLILTCTTLSLFINRIRARLRDEYFSPRRISLRARSLLPSERAENNGDFS